MNIIGMMSFFDEEAAWISRSLHDLHLLGVRRVVCVDGAYALYPEGRACSDDESIRVIGAVTEELGMESIVYQPEDVWAENEVGKRRFMLELALVAAEEGDWLCVWDCDYTLTYLDFFPIYVDGLLLPERLSTAEYRFADVSFSDSPDLSSPSWYPMRMFVRAEQGMTIGDAHYKYVMPDGVVSSVLPREDDPPALDLRASVFISHRYWERSNERRARQVAYYEARERLGIEG